jgi:hypothetical protein
MRFRMYVSEAQQAGFALAATIARDAGAKHAHIGIARDVSDAWCGLARDLERASKAERRERIRELTRAQKTRPATTSENPSSNAARRALALLAGRTFGADTLPRPGFTPEPALLALLHRIAQRAGLP